jgi:hypothetical protein
MSLTIMTSCRIRDLRSFKNFVSLSPFVISPSEFGGIIPVTYSSTAFYAIKSNTVLIG